MFMRFFKYFFPEKRIKIAVKLREIENKSHLAKKITFKGKIYEKNNL